MVELADRYDFSSGEGASTACERNAAICDSVGSHQLATTWRLLGQMSASQPSASSLGAGVNGVLTTKAALTKGGEVTLGVQQGSKGGSEGPDRVSGGKVKDTQDPTGQAKEAAGSKVGSLNTSLEVHRNCDQSSATSSNPDLQVVSHNELYSSLYAEVTSNGTGPLALTSPSRWP